MKDEAQRIFEIIDIVGMTEYEFAEKFGFRRSTLNSWKNDSVGPGKDMVKKFLDATGITSAEFYRGVIFTGVPETKWERAALRLKILSKAVLDAGRDDESAEVMLYLIRTPSIIAS